MIEDLHCPRHGAKHFADTQWECKLSKRQLWSLACDLFSGTEAAHSVCVQVTEAAY